MQEKLKYFVHVEYCVRSELLQNVHVHVYGNLRNSRVEFVCMQDYMLLIIHDWDIWQYIAR